MITSIYSKPTDTYLNSITNSPVYKNKHFTLIMQSQPNNENAMSVTDTIEGILNSVPKISLSSHWDVAGVSKISEKINKVSDNSTVKTFAQLSPTYMAPVLTDGWTQKLPNKGDCVSVDLSFRAYPSYMYNTTNYTTIIKALTYAITPQKYEFKNALDNIRKAVSEARTLGNEVVELANKYKETMKSIDGDDINKDALTTFEDSFGTTADQTSLAGKINTLLTKMEQAQSTGGCAKCRLQIEQYIDNINNVTNEVYFLITSWNFKPAMEITKINEKFMPVYVDFNISLTTDRYVNNDILAKILL